jgi:hypothetical protein
MNVNEDKSFGLKYGHTDVSVVACKPCFHISTADVMVQILEAYFSPILSYGRGLGSSVGIATELRAERSGDRIPVGSEIFRTCPDQPWGPPSLLYNGYRVFTYLLTPWSRVLLEKLTSELCS